MTGKIQQRPASAPRVETGKPAAPAKAPASRPAPPASVDESPRTPASARVQAGTRARTSGATQGTAHALAHATDANGQDIDRLRTLAKRRRSPETEWSNHRPLSQSSNAHRTNTKEEMREALQSDHNYFEGDIRPELNPPHALEMRHDTGQEDGDNLTFREWLSVGKESGRGLKMEFKDAAHANVDSVIKDIQSAGVPGDKLMFNIGPGTAKAWGPKIRKAFPDAIIAVGSPFGDRTVGAEEAKQMTDAVRSLPPGPTTFILNHRHFDPSAIPVLKKAGTISMWNDPNHEPGGFDPGARVKELRKLGIDGMIDLRERVGLLGQIEQGISKLL